MSEHSRISPSKLARIIACPASLKFVEGLNLPPGSSEAANEGTRLHDMMYRHMLTGAKLTDPLAIWAKEAIEPVIEGVEHLYLETKVCINELRDISGTADMFFMKDGLLTIVDYKFGQYEVHAEGNAQLMAYAYGAIKKVVDDGYKAPKEARMVIVQPKLERLSISIENSSAITAWMHSVVLPICDAALSDSAVFNPGEEQCRWCEGRTFCKACAQFASKTASEVFKAYKEDRFGQLSDDEAIDLYKRFSIVKALFGGLESRVRHVLSRGPKAGLKLVRARGRRAWQFKDDQQKLEVMDRLTEMGVDAFTSELKSAPALLKEYPFLKKEQWLTDHIASAPGQAMNIVGLEDPRTAVSEDPFSGYY